MKVRYKSHVKDRVPLMPVGSGNLINRTSRRSPRKKISPKVRKTLFFKAGREHKTLKGKRVFLDLQASGRVQHLKEKILHFGGIVEEFLSKELDLVITDKKTDDIKQGWASNSPFSGPSPLQQSSNRCGNQVGNMPCSTDSPQSIEVKRLEPGQTLRGKRLLKRAAFTQKLGTSDILTNAKTWGVKVVHIDTLTDWLMEDKAQIKKEKKVVLLSMSRSLSSSGLKVRALAAPFLKVEDLSRKYKPVYSELKHWPTLHLEPLLSESPFDDPKFKQTKTGEWECVKQEEKQVEKQGNVSYSSRYHMLCAAKKLAHIVSGIRALTPTTRINTEIKERTTILSLPTEKASLDNIKEKDEAARQPGYCECCNDRYTNIQAHLEGDQHQKFAKNEDNFAALDSVIARGRRLHRYLNILREEESDKHNHGGGSESIGVESRTGKLSSPISSVEVLGREALPALVTSQPLSQRWSAEQKFESTSTNVLLRDPSEEFSAPHKSNALKDNSLLREGYLQGPSLNSKTDTAPLLQVPPVSEAGKSSKSPLYQERAYCHFAEGKSKSSIIFGLSDSAVPSEIHSISTKQGCEWPAYPCNEIMEFIVNPESLPYDTSSQNFELREALLTREEMQKVSGSGELRKSPEQEKLAGCVDNRWCQSPTAAKEERRSRLRGRCEKKSGSAMCEPTKLTLRNGGKPLLGKDAGKISIASVSHKQGETDSIVEDIDLGVVPSSSQCFFADITKKRSPAQNLSVDAALFHNVRHCKRTAESLSHSAYGKSKPNHKKNRKISPPQGKGERYRGKPSRVTKGPIYITQSPVKKNPRLNSKKLCYEVCKPHLELFEDSEELTKVIFHPYEAVVEQVKSTAKTQRFSSRSNFVSKVEGDKASPTSKQHQLQHQKPTLHSNRQIIRESTDSLDNLLVSISNVNCDEGSRHYPTKEKATEPCFGSDEVKEKGCTDYSIFNGQPLAFASSIRTDKCESVGRPLPSLDASVFSLSNHCSTSCNSRTSARRSPRYKVKGNLCFETCEFSSEAEDSDKVCTINVESILTGITSSPIKNLLLVDNSVLEDSVHKRETLPVHTEACRDSQTQPSYNEFDGGGVLESRSRKRSTEVQCNSELTEREQSRTRDIDRWRSMINETDSQNFAVGLTERTKVRKRRASSAALVYLAKNLM